MRAVVIHEYGGPEVLKLEERPEPEVRDIDILRILHGRERPRPAGLSLCAQLDSSRYAQDVRQQMLNF